MTEDIDVQIGRGRSTVKPFKILLTKLFRAAAGDVQRADTEGTGIGIGSNVEIRRAGGRDGSGMETCCARGRAGNGRKVCYGGWGIEDTVGVE